MVNLLTLVGGAGLILISAGIIIKKRKEQNIFYIIGGVCLELYSIHIGDFLFMVLQIIFILAAVEDLVRLYISGNSC